MNSFWKTAGAAVAAGALCVLAFAQWREHPPDPCSDATLRGSYAFEIHGQILASNHVQTREGVAWTQFDGNGDLEQEDFVTANGVPVSGMVDGATGFHTDETGTYQVNANCTGSAEIDFPAPPGGSTGAVILLKFVLSDGGRVIHTVVSKLTPPGATAPVPAAIRSTGWRIEPGRDRGDRDDR